jgi:hypothetical protein
MKNTTLSPSLRSAAGTSLRPRHLNREERRLIRYYRSLADQDRDAIRCLMFAVKEASRCE